MSSSQGNNLIGETDGSTGWVASDLTGTIATPLNPLLAPLGDYGGPTQTMALLPGSPAIDAGNNALIPAGVTTDQRGPPRIVNGTVDIGAFESSGFTIAVTSGSGQTAAGAFAAPLVVTVTANNPNEPVAGGLVTFTPPASGASATTDGQPGDHQRRRHGERHGHERRCRRQLHRLGHGQRRRGRGLVPPDERRAGVDRGLPRQPRAARGRAGAVHRHGHLRRRLDCGHHPFVTWASATPSVATISGTGLASALAPGTSAITASLAGVTSPADTLTVIPPASWSTPPPTSSVSLTERLAFATRSRAPTPVGGGTHTITFAVPGAGVQTIAPLTPLPAIAASVLIDGTTQPGFAGTPLIAVDAGPAGGPAALTIAGSDVTVRGLAVDQFGFVTTTDLAWSPRSIHRA